MSLPNNDRDTHCLAAEDILHHSITIISFSYPSFLWLNARWTPIFFMRSKPSWDPAVPYTLTPRDFAIWIHAMPTWNDKPNYSTNHKWTINYLVKLRQKTPTKQICTGETWIEFICIQIAVIALQYKTCKLCKNWGDKKTDRHQLKLVTFLYFS